MAGLETAYRNTLRMSIKVMNLVWQNAPYRGNTLLTLLALADWSNDDGICWPKVEQLATKSRQSIRSAQYAVDELCQDEILAMVRNPGRGNRNEYVINLQKLHLFQNGEKVQNTTGKGAICDRKRCKTQQRNKEEPSLTVNNHQGNALLCRRCNSVGTYEHPGHPGAMVYCSCPAGKTLQKAEVQV